MGTYDPLPVDGSTAWGDHYRNTVSSVDARLTAVELSPAAAGTGTAGQVNVDSFPGSTDTAKLQAYIAYSNAQTYKPAGRLSNRQYTWAGPIDGAGAPGLTLLGPDTEREYKTTTSYKGMAASVKCRVSTTSTGGYFWGMSADWPAATFRGIHFDGGGQSHDFIQTPAGRTAPIPVLVHSAWAECGFTNYRHVFNVLVQGGSLHSSHFQSNAGHALYLQGADFAVGQPGRWTYIDNCGVGLASTRWGLDGSTVCALYITPTGAGCAVEVDRGSGTSFYGMNLDSPGQRLTVAEQCQGALIQLRGGSTQWAATRLYGGMHNPSGGAGGATYNKGLVTVTGGTHTLSSMQVHTIAGRNYGSMPSYPGDGAYPAGQTVTPTSTDHLWVGSGARVYLGAFGLTDDTTLGQTTGDTLRIRQATPGRIVTAPTIITG